MYAYKIIWHLLTQYISLHKEIVLQNSLRYNNFALLSPARFSEVESENFLPADAFSTIIFRREENVLTDWNFWDKGGGSLLPYHPHHDATGP